MNTTAANGGTQAIVPGTESHFIGNESPAVGAPVNAGEESKPEKKKRNRKPSKKVQALLNAEYERGVSHGINLRRAEPSGLLLWMGVMLGLGMAIGHFWL